MNVVEWLQSPEGERWSRRAHMPIWRPLISIVRDGEPSDVSIGDWEMIYTTDSAA